MNGDSSDVRTKISTTAGSHPTTIAELTKQINAQRAAAAVAARNSKPASGAKSLNDAISVLAKFNQEAAAIDSNVDDKAQIMSKIILSG